MTEPILDDYEKGLVRLFAQRYLDHREYVDEVEYPNDPDNPRRLGQAIDRLAQAKLIWLSPDENEPLAVDPACVELARQWDNPPLPDYRDKLTKWFWSKPWSVVVYVVVVGVPAAVGYVVMAKTILEWCGIIKGK
jgi:hypothetical protein